MARRITTTCDLCRCEAKEGATGRLSVAWDRKMDAAGDMDDVVADVDICAQCAADALARLLHEMGHEKAMIWLARVGVSL